MPVFMCNAIESVAPQDWKVWWDPSPKNCYGRIWQIEKAVYWKRKTTQGQSSKKGTFYTFWTKNFCLQQQYLQHMQKRNIKAKILTPLSLFRDLFKIFLFPSLLYPCFCSCYVARGGESNTPLAVLIFKPQRYHTPSPCSN